MKKFLNRGLWLILYLLFPITIVGLLSQNAIPGELLYPVKLSIENIGEFIFALTPESKAIYSTTLTDRRFYEAEKMIVYHSNTTGLDTLVAQATKTQELVQSIQDPKQKATIQEKLIQDINYYQEKLTQTQQKVDPTFIPPPTPTPTLITPTQVARIYIEQNRTIQSKDTNSNQKTSTPTPTMTPPPPLPTTPQTPLKIIDDIEQTKQQLEQIKKKIQFSSEQTQTESTNTENSPTPSQLSPTPTPFIFPSITFPPSPTYYYLPKSSDQIPPHSTKSYQESKSSNDETSLKYPKTIK